MPGLQQVGGNTYGWMDSVLRVDLSSGRVEEENLGEDLYHDFLGGRGLGVRILFEELKTDTDPLSPENKLIFSVGPLTATRAPTSGRVSISTKSPLTGTILDCNAGGHWGPEFKRTGHDALIIEGRAEKPSIIVIDNDSVEIREAGSLWGRGVHETTSALSSLDGKQFKVACIGPAGERKVLISSIMLDKTGDGRRGGVAARGGPGAVMGSKNLKAVVVRGRREVSVHDANALSFFVAETNKKLKESPITSRALPRFGTDVLMNVINAHGMLPVRNFQEGYSPLAYKVSGEELTHTILRKRSACYGCPIGCGRKTKTDGLSGDGPEYESTFALGPECGVFDIRAVAEANYLCNDLGIDTISAGVTIGCAMELSERGILEEPIKFGDANAVKDLIVKIARREGLGELLAQGSKRLADSYGVPEYSMSVKGLELPAYDPRGAQGMALAYATSNRGGCHLRGYMIGWEVLGVPKLIDRFTWSGKADILAREQDLYAAMDSLVVCKFVGYNVNQEYLARLLRAVTGLDYTPEDVMLVGERIYNLERCFNVREGFTRRDDTLPRRFLEEPLEEGESSGVTVRLDEMLDEYYRVRHWTREGVPTSERLEELGLGFAKV